MASIMPLFVKYLSAGKTNAGSGGKKRLSKVAAGLHNSQGRPSAGRSAPEEET